MMPNASRMPAVTAARLLTLDEGLEALGLQIASQPRQQLMAYLALMEKWNRVYNLTAVRDPAAMVTHHLLDSLAVLPALRRRLAARASNPLPGTAVDSAPAARLLDVGSGAGLPGVVLAIAEPTWSVTCVDAVAKKAGFIRQVAAALGLRNLQALHTRVEALRPAMRFDVVTSRAFASLADFCTLTAHLVDPAGCWMAMKGKVPTEQLAAVPDDVSVFHVEPLTVPGLDAQRNLIWMRSTPL